MVIKVGVADVDVRVSSHLKEELAWAVYKRVLVISTLKTTRVLSAKRN